MTSILNEAELELVMGAGAAGEAVGRFIGAAASGTTPIGSGNAGNIGAAIGGKVEDKVTNACNFVVAVVKAL